ncbi:unnamed protein product [Gongylonema pulchrum]|uniref:RRM domain-containing protein n=1 Tax=Gongylonema pulchrum TaxID=637853 RepID=A0A3P7NTZ5_9BILA|nr:unnamed protein product [Gongylonema pulchrum]
MTKTVHLGPRTSTNEQTAQAPKFPAAEAQSVRSASIQSEREKYIEIRRRRKQEKENRLRLLDLQRRKSDLMSKEIEQQKMILEKMKEPNITPEKKKHLYKLFKKIEAFVTKTKAEISELNEKLLKMNADSEEKAAADAAVAEAGVGIKRVARSEGNEITLTTKKPRLLDSSKPGAENDVIIHMEHFGELIDMEFGAPGQDKKVTAYFTYKKRRDAEQAAALGADYPGGELEVELAPKRGAEGSGVIPDEKRKPSERVTPAALLATCPLEESDDEENED